MGDGRFKRLLSISDEEISKVYNSGKSISEIAIALSVSPQTIGRAIKRTGAELRHKNHKIQRSINKKGDRYYIYPEISKVYQSGISIPKVCEKFGCSAPTVIRALRDTGTQSRSVSEGLSLAARGNKRLDTGYITVCNGMNERKKEHVLIAESVLGRKLKKGECVHHINQVKTDNRHENLLVCTIGYHTSLHAKMRKIQKQLPNTPEA